MCAYCLRFVYLYKFNFVVVAVWNGIKIVKFIFYAYSIIYFSDNQTGVDINKKVLTIKKKVLKYEMNLKNFLT